MGVALGDIDGDGDLDLVCGNYFGSTTLFLNENGTFSTIPAWSGLEQSTTSIALGDVDGDEDLDLVCGRYGESSVLYRNEGGVFSTAPVWSSPAQETYGVALGDVDGDGDLDLLCANGAYPGRASGLFMNQGGVFSTVPAWTSPSMDVQCGVFGDIDNDGDLDIVLGGYNAGIVFYLNNGGVFSRSPTVWPSSYVTSIALGDLDGDGDQDLVCGSSGSVLYGVGSTTAYLNEEGSYSATPFWTSPEQPTTSVALGDVDGDGDLDLICGNNGQGSTLFMNERGVFSAAPAWSSSLRYTKSVALGDVDNDGDIDLIVGGADYMLSALYLGAGNPVFRGNTSTPINHLPNNSALLQDVQVWPADKNLYRVRVKAVDVESDPLWIAVKYNFEGQWAAGWHRADIVGYVRNVGPLATSPTGIDYEFDWDLSEVPLDQRNAFLRLRAISNPRRTGFIQHVASYQKRLGPLDVHHPQATVSTAWLSFPTVTVGDTVSLDIEIANTGNERLNITRIDLPSNEMRIDQDAPMPLEPGQRVDITVFCEPRLQTAIGGIMTIESNDPFNALWRIWTVTDIRALQTSTELLSTAPELPLGQAVTVVSTPLPQVRIERGWVFYRSGNSSAAFQDSVQLSKYKDNYIATIPDHAVTEGGLQYYIRVENSGVFATDPPGAPDDSVFSRAVAAPQSIMSAPQPNAGADFLEARDVKVQVSLPIGAEFVEGTLHHRRGGESVCRSSPLEAGNPLPFAVIPDSLVGPRGLEYWVEVQTLTRTLTDPAHTPDRSPHAIRISVSDLVEERQYPERSYRMVSVPLDFGPEFTGTLEALLSDQAAFGPYDPVKWRAYRYLPAAKSYAELSEAARQEFVPKPGKAFWLISASKNRIGTAPVRGLSTATDSAYALVLEPGWNMVGNPFNFPVAWDSITVDGIKMADAESTTVQPPVGWVINKGYRMDEQILEPFGGYWVKNLSDASVVLRIPAREAVPAAEMKDSLAVAVSSGASATHSDWRFEVRAVSCGVEDSGNHAGMSEGAVRGWDRHDRSEPPMSPGRAISLYFPHRAWETHRGDYAVDIRGGYEAVPPAELGFVQANEELWGHVWRFDVAKNFEEAGITDEVTLEIRGIDGAPAEASIYLLDKHLGRCIDVREERSYMFYSGRREAVSEDNARFALVVGSAEFAESGKGELPNPPERTVLHQNYPNPFNPSTIIRYDLARADVIRLAVYDASGALVRVLFDGGRPAGRYEAVWDGRNENGRPVSTGIYFTRLRTRAGVNETRKMLLVR